MNKYLLDEHPLIVIPKLAIAVGLNEAIVLQQINYWLNKSNKVIDGKKWTYNSYKDWQKQLPFWDTRTIQRIFRGLEKDKLISTGKFNKMKFDKTKWYTIEYDNLSSRIRQVDVMEDDKLTQPIPDTNTDTSSDTSLKTYSPAKAEPPLPFDEIVSFLNDKAGTKYHSTSAKTKKLIHARFKDGFSLEDFKTVITKKTDEWLNTDMAKYLRPETLFGTKFESYLNQKRGADPSDPWSQHYE
ncbi:conserved phage C-terminal domain-containing protein [Liquorilactobacillus vini]|uniref:conserved phage C-terminal domain-containing protein n=1 Tax=Liquorilactobacillus vini TaxID=238015 RepID=UPI0002FB7515|nr:conserved phage C-terminal domain-containing protein [Liquorilactobacillus vini]